MPSVVTNILVVILAFAGMEVIAWCTHKYIMHGILWRLHKDHHHKESKGFLEHNDAFFLIFALPGIAALYFGRQGDHPLLFWTGAGITLYGLAYFLIHDIFIHQRFRLFRHSRNAYFLALRRAHKMHHRHIGRENGECFGMLWVPRRFFKKGPAKTNA